MLVLTRKVGDMVAIGDNIKIVVMAIKGKQVRLGIQADKNTVVHREEVYQKIQAEMKAAKHADIEDTRAAQEVLKEFTQSQLPGTVPTNAPKKVILRKAPPSED